MRTVKLRVETFRIRIYCDDCGGEIKYTGSMNTLNASHIYLHRCVKCSKLNYLDIEYPNIEYKEVEI